MKKIIAVILSAVFICTVFTACSPEETTVETPPKKEYREFGNRKMAGEYMDYWEEKDFITSVYDTETLAADGIKPEDATVKASAMVTDYMLYTDHNLDTPEGYEWRLVVREIEFGGGDYEINYGVRVETDYFDYYDVTKVYRTKTLNDDGTYTFTVEKDGAEYTECRYKQEYRWGEWSYEGVDFTIMDYFCVPAGYDGMCVALMDSRIPVSSSAPVYEKVNDNTLYFRLDNNLSE